MNRAKKKHETVGGGQASVRALWPEPISRDLKETRLQQFLEQMSMSKFTSSHDRFRPCLRVSSGGLFIFIITRRL